MNFYFGVFGTFFGVLFVLVLVWVNVYPNTLLLFSAFCRSFGVIVVLGLVLRVILMLILYTLFFGFLPLF